MYVYIQTGPQLFTVGFYDPKGRWHADSDYPTRDAAAWRVHFLNGGHESTERWPAFVRAAP